MASEFSSSSLHFPSHITVRSSGSTSTWGNDIFSHGGGSLDSRKPETPTRSNAAFVSSSSFNLSPGMDMSARQPAFASSSNIAPPNIHHLPEDVQEKFIVQELMYILSGVDSSIITCDNATPSQIRFTVDQRVAPTLRDFALQVAALACHYYTVNRFVEEIHKYEDGKVAHALVSVIQDFLKEYFIMLTQLDTEKRKGDLNLRNLWFFINPSLAKMSVVSSIVIEIEEKKLRGGSILSLLHEKAITMSNSCDMNLCLMMAKKASGPYFEMLQQWIYKGIIRDRFGEFFVEDSDTQRQDGAEEGSDTYWEKRYKPKPENCPNFLSRNLMQVLKAGKYLNVMRHCGKDVKAFEGQPIEYSIHERDYSEKIEKAYFFSSKKLLAMLLEEYDIMKRLESVKHYLLMAKGDFIVQFMDLTDAELCKPIDDLNPSRLESLMGLALRTSSSSTDPYKDSLKVQLFPFTIGQQLLSIIAIETPTENKDFPKVCNYNLPGTEGFSFSYDASWPVSLILTPRVIVCYQLIFRHLFFCKHVERQLCNVWILSKGNEISDTLGRREKAAIYSLRQKMLNFVQNFEYYMTFEVIEPAWNTFLATMQKVTNVDDVLECHMALINSILDDSLLTIEILFQKVNKLLTLCLRFCKKMTITYSQPKMDHNLHERLLAADAKFSRMLATFLHEVSEATQTSNKSTKLGNIIHRMNFNGYYSAYLEELFQNQALAPWPAFERKEAQPPLPPLLAEPVAAAALKPGHQCQGFLSSLITKT